MEHEACCPGGFGGEGGHWAAVGPEEHGTAGFHSPGTCLGGLLAWLLRVERSKASLGFLKLEGGRGGGGGEDKDKTPPQERNPTEPSRERASPLGVTALMVRRGWGKGLKSVYTRMHVCMYIQARLEKYASTCSQFSFLVGRRGVYIQRSFRFFLHKQITL